MDAAQRLQAMETEAQQLAESVALMVGNLQTNLHAVRADRAAVDHSG